MTATLEDVKAHLHIFHSVEDDYLRSLLEQSAIAVETMTGIDKGPQFDELVLNRVRFAYNDKLDEFESRYQSVLLNASLKNLEGM
ncbi:MAG: head-tail connector protein [Ligilactobacillus animalis]|uniref:head-tail connector protein n=1 Tax=Ligilactobacillus animalis TaxID=1605 RepID=UPI00242DCED4|nr:head-tail connector protein [Ligilactobacillus animalis]MCI5942914.1 head-tail connector protein [Ligilactobacillus animalis]MDY2993748.1 head-tail connector protein [Ligilactobacillus animalis]